jgi:protein N-terminal amidase
MLYWLTVFFFANASALGYNFSSIEAIRPYLEVQNEGPSAQWARRTASRLKCKVCIGYPEVSRNDTSTTESDSEKAETFYNSMLLFDETGKFVHNYRKRFLYYTDEIWASEGEPEWSFKSLEFNTGPTKMDADGLKLHVPTTFGICMDINPYKFEAPFTEWEFANRVLDSQSHLVILPTAWLVADAAIVDSMPGQLPDMDTFNYWIRRFWPLIDKKINYSKPLEGFSTPTEKNIVLIFANRTGFESGADIARDATYAGTSTIVTITQKIISGSQVEPEDSQQDENAGSFEVKIHCWDIKGAREEGICFADTTTEPKMTFVTKKRSDDDNYDSE